jgi:hypothetical protein
MLSSMKTSKSIVLALVIAVSGPAVIKANDDVKTLPPETYKQMKHGKKLEKVWVGPDYDNAKGFNVGSVEYKAETRNGTVMDYLPKALATLAKTNSPATLQVTVTKVTTKSFTGFGNAMGHVTVEGKIVGAKGKVLSCLYDQRERRIVGRWKRRLSSGL